MPEFALPEQNPISEPQIAAFFDLDNTLIRGASIYHLARGLYAKGVLGPSDLVSYLVTQAKFQATGKENKSDFAKVAANTLSFVQDRSAAELSALIDEIVEDVLADKMWPGTIELAERHLAAEHEVWLVSATPIELARAIANRLGLTGAIATESEIVDGNYTGKLSGSPLHGPAKARAVSELAKVRNLDLKNSYAYSDSANDIPMLSLVGQVSVVNPDAQLRNFALVNQWSIFDFKKDHVKEKYRKPVATTALAVIGAGAGIAIAAISRSRKKL